MGTLNMMSGLKVYAVSMVIAAATLAVTFGGAFEPVFAEQSKATRGALRCAIASGRSFIFGSTRNLDCVYEPARNGKSERYSGRIRKFGIDLGFVKKGVIIWQVIAPVAPAGPGALSGKYAGVSAQVAVGAGVGANALVSGNKIMLNPISLSGASGLNLAIGVAGLELTYGGRR